MKDTSTEPNSLTERNLAWLLIEIEALAGLPPADQELTLGPVVALALGSRPAALAEDEMSGPMRAASELAQRLAWYNRTRGRRFDPDDMALLATVAHTARKLGHSTSSKHSLQVSAFRAALARLDMRWGYRSVLSTRRLNSV
jgi:hypothetical protein